MHSSRMRTARPRIDRGACMWGGGRGGQWPFLPGGEVTGQGGRWPRTPPPPRPGQVTSLPGQVTSPPEPGHHPHDHVTYPMMHLVLTPPSSWTEWVTHACENMTFARFATRALRSHSLWVWTYPERFVSVKTGTHRNHFSIRSVYMVLE